MDYAHSWGLDYTEVGTPTIVLFVREWGHTVDSELLLQAVVKPVVMLVTTADRSPRALHRKGQAIPKVKVQ